MTTQELIEAARGLMRRLEELRDGLDLDQRRRELAELENKSSDPDLWQNPEEAQKLLSEISRRKQELAPWDDLTRRGEDVQVLAELAQEEKDAAAAREAEQALEELRGRLREMETAALLSGEYDRSNAIISINAGAGGTESCDWVDMLTRMYFRWAEDRGYSVEMIDRTPGESAGSRSMTAVISGPHAYGYLKAERGVHRLVRLSPFDAAHRRHTSFASVDVIPEVEREEEVEINPDDLRVDTFRATGAGGQHVNKTDSAVRITHVPTGIVVQSQNERSQHQNRVNAMKVLKARLLERKIEEQERKLAEMRGEPSEIAWGNQIRSYVLQPYVMVKDHRTGYQTGNAEAVLEGDVDQFIRAYLEHRAGGRHDRDDKKSAG
ncbi:MAG: peptide chain release factor 2 [Armatimonadota bacterium]|nr:MAG: peptide chain release factor 2 [Armatimonadota bacterium]